MASKAIPECSALTITSSMQKFQTALTTCYVDQTQVSARISLRQAPSHLLSSEKAVRALLRNSSR